jgi:hypothetical protein
VEKYLPKAIELTLTQRIADADSLTKQEKVIISKIYKNLNIICKLSIKEVKEVLKAEPAYQEALADVYFDKRINNYMLITSYEKPVGAMQRTVLQTDAVSHPLLVCGVEYRIEFTLSNIAKKNVMRPVVLLLFRLKDGSSLPLYFSLEQFSLLRAKAANAMKQVFGIELRAL